jgi:hypothetical protein
MTKPTTNSTTIRTPRGESKVVKAAKIFSDTIGFSRKIVLARLQKEVGLTEKGASTYYQNCRRKAGMVTSREGGSAVA